MKLNLTGALLAIFFLSCNSIQSQKSTLPHAEMIRDIRFDDIIDLCGGSGNPYLFFDEQKKINPELDSIAKCVTRDMPNGQIYYPHYWGDQWRWAVDLRGRHHLKKIWYYVDKNSYFVDTLFFYSTKDFTSFKQIAAVNIPMGANGWYFVTVNDTTRYLVSGMKRSHEKVYNSFGTVNITEIIPYGTLTDAKRLPAAPATYAGAMRPKKAIGDLIGVNIIGGYEPMFNFDDFAHVRAMNERSYMDDMPNTSMTDKKFNADHFNEYSGGAVWRPILSYLDSFNIKGILTTPEFNGSSKKVMDQNKGNNPGWPVNNLNDNPLVMSSYTESGRFFWTLGAIVGNVKMDSTKVPLVKMPRKTGRNFRTVLTNGNEINRFWGAPDTSTTGWRYISNYLYLLQSQVDYDGYESTLGSNLGLANADPKLLLGMAADYKPDSLVVQSRVQLSRAMRKDKKNVFGVYEFNEYPDSAYSDHRRSRHAIEYNLSGHIQKNVQHAYKLDSSMQIFWTENGMDANPNTDKATPLRTGNTWTDREWQAINLGYNIIEVSKTNVDRYFIYVMVTNAPEDNGATFQTADLMSSYPAVVRKASFYYVKNLIRTLREYRHEKTISSQWKGLVVEKYRSITRPEEVAYVVGNANTNGSTLTNQTIQVGNVAGDAIVHDLSFTEIGTKQSSLKPANGVLTVPVVSEKPIVIKLVEKP
ncbi:MAG: hypothetical protein QM731_11210 [Chitinophagaceae bacterium]